jgi:hypothetical protein
MASVLESPISPESVRDEISLAFGSVFARTMRTVAEADLEVGALR